MEIFEEDQLTREGAKARRDFVKYWLHAWKPEWLKNLTSEIFSDECSLQNNTNSPVTWVF